MFQKLKRARRTATFENNKNALTLDRLMEEALISGVNFFEIGNYTFGELISVVKAFHERKRRENQDKALIAMRQAQLMTAYIAGKGSDYKVYDIFPYFTNEEKEEMLLAEYKAKMFKIAARGRC